MTTIPGTTRDLVSENAEFAGIPVRLIDTAGIRETGRLIERLGIERAFEAMADADLTIVVIDGAVRDHLGRRITDRAGRGNRAAL